jgi:hypothetical protein
MTTLHHRTGSTGTTGRTLTRRLRIRALVAVVVAGAALGTLSTGAGAATVPYATAGTIACGNGTTVAGGFINATGPYYFSPANPALAARFPGELDYYKMDVQLWTNSGWATIAPGGWNPTYASYRYMGPSTSMTWSFALDRGNWTINQTGYYRVLYTMYWSPTGQQASVGSSYCYITKPVGGGEWGMW